MREARRIVERHASEVVARLCALSRQAAVPLERGIEWPTSLARDGWYLSAGLSSLEGTDAYTGLSQAERRRLSRLEAINFFSLNIAGERHLIAGLAERLHVGIGEAGYSSYLHYFLDEENKHLFYFAEACARLGSRVYPHPTVSFPRDYAPGEADFLFFAKILMFEEIVDHYNVHMAADAELEPIARAVNEQHHLDEVRHLAFGRLLVKDLFTTYSSRWSDETLVGVRLHLADYLESMWRQYYNPAVYADAGLAEPYRLADRAFNSPAAVERRRVISAKRLGYLRELNILGGQAAT
jgi:hypothetical protein